MRMYMKTDDDVNEDGTEEGTEEGNGGVNLGVMVGHVLMVVKNHKVTLRSDVAMTLVTMSIAEGLITQLDPELDMISNAIPYFVRLRSWNSSAANLRFALSHTQMMPPFPSYYLPICLY